MQFICSLITVESVAAARELYEGILGQKVKADYGENVAFEGGFAIHERAHFSRLIGGRPIVPRSDAFELYFEDDEVAALEAELRGAGYDIVHGAVEQPWRQLVLRFRDRDGNLIEVGESLPHLAWRLGLEGKPVAEISAITYLPEAEVEAAMAAGGRGQTPDQPGV
jgi:catechol 2,3-dioxygenase-like lactoylglutathione lyase family enzyme